MQSFPMLVKEVLKDGRAGKGLNYFVGYGAARGDVRVAEAKCVGSRDTVVGLVGGVGGGTRVDAPGAEAEVR